MTALTRSQWTASLHNTPVCSAHYSWHQSESVESTSARANGNVRVSKLCASILLLVTVQSRPVARAGDPEKTAADLPPPPPARLYGLCGRKRRRGAGGVSGGFPVTWFRSLALWLTRSETDSETASVPSETESETASVPSETESETESEIESETVWYRVEAESWESLRQSLADLSQSLRQSLASRYCLPLAYRLPAYCHLTAARLPPPCVPV